MIRKVEILALVASIVFAFVSCAEKSTSPMDQEKPIVYFILPPNNITREGDVDVKIEANDNIDIARVDLYVDNVFFQSDFTHPYSFVWPIDSSDDEGTKYILSVMAVDVNGNAAWADDLIKIVKGYNPSPVAEITGPADGSSFAQGAPVPFRGTAIDTLIATGEVVALDDSLIYWKSDLQGDIGLQGELSKGSNFEYYGLIIGEHKITMTATDSTGISVTTDPITVTITPNNLYYATVGAVTYYISEPGFKKGKVEITRPFYISKTEMSVKEFCELLIYYYGGSKFNSEFLKATSKYITTREIYEDLYKFDPKFNTSNPNLDDLVYPDYPACLMYYIFACLASNAKSHQEGLVDDIAYSILDKNDNDMGGQAGTKVITIGLVKKINLNHRAKGWRLPTEAEWEVAARAGFAGKKFPWGDNGPAGFCNSMSAPLHPDVLSLYNGRGISPVISYSTNRYGLYNMVGNVAELCSDMYVGTPPSGERDPLAIVSVKLPFYLAKGGAWYEFGADMQICMRHLILPFSTSDVRARNSGIGLRVVRNFTD